MNMTDVLTEAKNIVDTEAVSLYTTITKEEHKLLMFGAKFLNALKAEGLEDWEGFERAVSHLGTTDSE